MKPISLDKLGAAVRRLNSDALAGTPQYRRIIVAPQHVSATEKLIRDGIPPAPAKKPRRPKAPSKTEHQAMDYLLTQHRCDIRWNAVSFKLLNGHRYTPDLHMDLGTGRRQVFIEVKGSYRLGSLQRSRLAFDQAKREWPCFDWWWMEKQKDGTWKITTH